ncbi:MAG: urea carboxylase [Vulcanimicrobiaceae bacterium]
MLVANRGEIAARIIATLRRLDIASVAVHSDADRYTRPVLDADAAIRIGGDAAAASYLDVDAIVAACVASGADAVHPGYGFLSENTAFAQRLADAGIALIGPRPEHVRAFGLKHTARELARRAGVPLLPGSGVLATVADALAAAETIGYPAILKSTAGGGGIGMQVCTSPDDLVAKFETVRRLGASNFGDDRVYLERYVARARHVEVQVFGDGRGRAIALGERDCTLQRRHQKVVEETPAPDFGDDTRARMHAAAVALVEAVAYESAGTVEFIYDAATGAFFFLEVNTRLQVEHGITELRYGIDLVEWMIRQAEGAFTLPEPGEMRPHGHALEARVYAEDPAFEFRPSAGIVTLAQFPSDARVDTWIETGTTVTPHYDPLLAKIMVVAATRDEAIVELQRAIRASAIAGIQTNLAYLDAVLGSDAFATATMTTQTLATFVFNSPTVHVVRPGVQSMLQELPGRVGFWHVGVPPSGPMDDRSFRLANRIVGNDERTCALEMALAGATLRFDRATRIALAGAHMPATLDDRSVPYHTSVDVPAGGVLALGSVTGPGSRTYLAVRGGFDAPLYLGSRATFVLGRFGGHATGTLTTGDVLALADVDATLARDVPAPGSLDVPPLTHAWDVGVVYGPHGAPEFFTDADIDALFTQPYEVHFNSDRTGIRLIGPKPAWARRDGGEAGLHPSNIHDNAYAIGSLDFTGDVPIVLGPDGPSLGGFVCPAVVASDERWKLGQLRAGDTIRFFAVDAVAVRDVARAPQARAPRDYGAAVIARGRSGDIDVTYRIAGDENVLVEYGPIVLDIGLRLRVHLLMAAVLAERIPGTLDVTPGIRSLQVHYDRHAIDRATLVATLQRLEERLPDVDDVTVPSRTVYLPLSWNDDAAQLAMRKYQELVRPDAPWCPSNIEFIRRINGLASVDDVYATVFGAEYLVLGLGDVYLGAPVATPLDPRHRLVTTKYNPARTWTPENAVGIGGAYLCVYGMEGPGGYQLVGRTIPCWNSWRTTKAFEPGTPWLLRFFDRIRFFPVTPSELLEAREAFPHGRYDVRIDEGTFDYRAYRAFLARDAETIEGFRTTQRAAFDAERRDWQTRGLETYVARDVVDRSSATDTLPAGSYAVESPVPGNVWKILVEPGSRVVRGETLVILESMKMELEITALQDGTVAEIRCTPGRAVAAGTTVVVMSASDAA